MNDKDWSYATMAMSASDFDLTEAEFRAILNNKLYNISKCYLEEYRKRKKHPIVKELEGIENKLQACEVTLEDYKNIKTALFDLFAVAARQVK